METIFVIDDRATNRKVLKRLAQAAQGEAEIKTFADPRDAIEDAADRVPDLVVTDFEMPHMNGAEFTRHFRAMPMCFDVPVIVVTAYENKQSRLAAFEMGATDFMLSPVDHQEFQARVRNFMQIRRRQMEARERNIRLERQIANDTALHRVEIEESKEFLRQVIDAVPALISVTDVEGRIRAVNSYMAAQLNKSKDQIVGRGYEDTLGRFDARRHAKLDQQIIETGEGLPTFEEELLDGPDGRRTYLTVKSPIRGGQDDSVSAVVNVSLDITDRKRIEKLAAHQQNRQRVLLDNIPNFVSATDEKGRYTLVNLAFAGALGTTPEAMIGTKLADHISDRDLIDAGLSAHAEVLDSGRPIFTPEQRFVARDQTLWMQIARVPFIFSTGEIEILTVRTDISARKKAMETLSQAKEAAEVSSEAKTKFLAVMSHELRTPLNHIMGFAEMISEETLGPIGQPSYKDYAADIHKSGGHLLALIERILEFSRFEAGEVTLACTSVDVNRLIVRLLAENNTAASARNIMLISNLDPVLHTVEGDEKLLARTIDNLLSNAVKFTEAGGTITVQSNCLADNWVEISVRDTGIGMKAKDIPNAFLPFRQLANVMDRTHEGTGLGLALAKQFTRMHNGKIELSSEPGIGTIVSVRLPLRQTGNST